jgi:hypothetical protein
MRGRIGCAPLQETLAKEGVRYLRRAAKDVRVCVEDFARHEMLLEVFRPLIAACDRADAEEAEWVREPFVSAAERSALRALKRRTQSRRRRTARERRGSSRTGPSGSSSTRGADRRTNMAGALDGRVHTTALTSSGSKRDTPEGSAQAYGSRVHEVDERSRSAHVVSGVVRDAFTRSSKVVSRAMVFGPSAGD